MTAEQLESKPADKSANRLKYSAAAVAIVAALIGAWALDMANPQPAPPPRAKTSWVWNPLATLSPSDSSKSVDELEKMARQYRWGTDGVGQDLKQAVKYYEMAAKKGSARSYCDLGYLYEEGLGVPKDNVKAFEMYQNAAELGDMVGQHNVACMYDEGSGVEKNYAEALKWYTKAAEQDYPFSQINLGVMYERGHGVKQDYKKAFEWHMRAAENPKPDMQAFYNIATYYENGTGVKQDFKKAFEWYQRAANGNAIYALDAMGQFYRDGKGVEKDYAKALELFLDAAGDGYSSAAAHAAQMYAEGLGTRRNMAQAEKFYRKAAEGGSMEGSFNLGLIYARGEGQIAKDPSEAKHWFEVAAKAWSTPDWEQDAGAQFGLGTMYEYGYYLPKNKQSALLHYRKAAKLGNEDARKRLSVLAKN